MRKTVLLLFPLLLCISVSTQLAYGQISSIRKNIKELYFEIDFPISKYDLRKKIHSNENFYNISESKYEKSDVIMGDFTQNYKLSYTRNADRFIVFWYEDGSDENYCTSIELDYNFKNIAEATKQFNEIIGFF